MNQWKKVKLGEICNSQYGYTASANTMDTGTKFLRITDIVPNQIDWTAVPYCKISDKEREKYLLHKGDIVVARTGATVGYAKYIKNDVQSVFASYLVRFTVKEKDIDSAYIGLCVESNDFKDYINSIATGSAQPNANSQMMSSYEIPLPPLPTQHRIASILSRYDLLIENYQHQIKLLEEAAQRLYKQWFVDLKFPGYEKTVFVDGIPQGWERKAISQLGEYLNGFAFKPSDWQKSGKPIIKIKEMGNGVGEDTPRNKGERVPDKYLVKAGDLLFSWSATLMVIVWSGEDGWLNQHLFKVTPIKGIGREFLLQSISNTIEEFQNLTTGSTMKHIQRNKLDQVFVNVPNNEIMKKYNNIAEKERAEILHLSLQIRHLTEARDRLLPKLMNGEIEV